MTKKLLLLNGIAVLMIPFHHATSFGLQAMFFWTNRYRPVSVPNFDQLGTLPYYITLGIRQLDSFGVPAFLFVSGYFIAFLARGKQANVSLPTVIPRIKVLLIPFAIWTAIRYILLHRPPTSIHEILDPYYFIVLLVQFYLLSPIIVPFAKSNWKILLIVVALIQFIAAEGTVYLQLLGLEIPGLSTIIAWTPRWFFPGRLFYFALGIVAGIHYEGFKEWLVEVKWHLLAVVVITGFLSLLEYELADRISGETWLGPNNPGFSRMIYASSVSLCFLAFEGGSIPFSKIISGLGAKSLGIYLGNLPAAYVAASIMYKLTPSALGNQLLYQSVLWLAALGVPLLLMEVVRRTPFRSGYRYLFG